MPDTPQDLAESILDSAELDELASLSNKDLAEVLEELIANATTRLEALREDIARELAPADKRAAFEKR